MDKEAAWIQFKAKYSIGQKVSGKIAYKAQFGVFLDIGEEFLCLLEIISINDLNYELYESGKVYKVGELVEGTVVGFTDNNRQMRITQKNWNKK